MSEVAGTFDLLYWYQVTPVNEDPAITSPTSYSAPVDCWSLPAVPTGVAAVPLASNEVQVSWTNTSQGASAFAIERYDPSTSQYVLIDTIDAVAGTNSYVYIDSTVAPQTSYQYIILSQTPDGNVSAVSATATSAATPSAGVAGLTATETSTTQIDLAWTPNVTDATGFIVYRSTDGQNFTELTPSPALDGSSTGYSDTGLTPNTHYWYQVAAVEPGGTTGVTAVDAYTLPAAPSGLTATLESDNTVTLAWTNNSDSSTTFLIEVFDTGTSAYDVLDATVPGATSYTGLSAIDGASSQYQVVAESGDDAGGATSNVYALPLALDAPSNLAATSIGSGEIDLTWDDNSATATSYEVFRSTSATGTFTNIGGPSASDGSYYDDTTADGDSSTIQPGTQYYYYVQAINSLMSSAASATVGAATDPTFSVSGPSSTNVGDTYTLTPTVNFDQSQSDPITSWNIDWGDTLVGSGGSSVSGDPSHFTHVYATAGSYVIAVTPVTANGPVDDTAFQNVTVNPPSPALTLMRDTSSSGPTIVLDAAFDAHGATTTGDIIVNWGDGNQQGYSTTATMFSHTYADNEFNVGMSGAYYGHPGVYGAGFSVTASILTSVNVASATIGVGVSDYTTNVPDVVLLGPRINVRLGDAVNEENTWVVGVIAPLGSDGGSSTYGNGTTIPPFPSTFDWGDGSPPDTRMSSIFDDEIRSHTYLKEGTYGETFAGGDSTSQTAITVFGPPLTLSQPDPQTVEPGESVNVTTSYTGLVGSGYAFVDWGDGKGPQALGGDLNSGGASLPTSGSLTARYARVPTSGLSGTFYLYDMHGNLVTQSFSVSCATDETLLALNPEAVNNGKAGAELVGADKQAGIYVPKSNATNPKTGALIADTSTQSPTSYWAPFVIHIGPGVKQDPLTFVIPPDVRVNTKDDGSGTQIKNRKPFPGLTDGQVLYVEAIKVGSYAITVTDPLLQKTPLDSLNVTSFWMSGPNDVPQYGQYPYQTIFPKTVPAPAAAKWLSTTGGKMTPANGNPDPNSMQVQWYAGPTFGASIYEATANYSWHLTVNVVQINVTTPPNLTDSGLSNFKTGAVTENKAGGLVVLTTSGNGDPGISYQADLQFTGPGGIDSVKYITAGFMQSLTVTKFDATYTSPAGNVTRTPFFKGKSAVGVPFYDQISAGAGWYYANLGIGFPHALLKGSDYATNAVADDFISASDSPGGLAPQLDLATGTQVIHMDWTWDFNLFVVATTSEYMVKGTSYAAQALAQWQFSVGDGATPRNQNVNGNLDFTGTKKVTAPTGKKWTVLTGGGLIQPVFTLPTFNYWLHKFAEKPQNWR